MLDSTAAILLAIKAAQEAGGGTVTFPAGTFKVKELSVEFTSNTAPVNLEGVGRQATLLVKNEAGATPVIKYKCTTVGEYINNSRIANMTVFGKAKEGPGIVVEKGAFGAIENVEFVNCSAGFEGKGVTTIWLQHCIAFSGNTKGFVLTKDAGSVLGANEVTLSKCVASNCKTVGIEADYCPGLLIDACDIESNGEAAKLTTGGIIIGANVTAAPGFGAGMVTIRDSWLEGNFGRAITAKSGDLGIRGSMIFQTDEATTTTEGRDVFAPSTLKRLTISECKFTTNVASKNQIVVEGTTTKGEISNSELSQFYSVPETILVKQDAYYTSPLRFGTATLGSPTQIETIGTGLALVAGSWSVKTEGQGLAVKEGTNGKQGLVTLVTGEKVVANTSVTANSRIFLTVQKLGTVTEPVPIAVTARTPGTSFTIKSSKGTDTSEVAYEIFEPST